MTDDDTPVLDPDTWLGEFHRRRVEKNQDIVVLVSDWHNRRGTGKSVISVKLAAAMDMTEEGLTADKCTLDAQQLTEAYTSQPPGSALLLDEAEAGLSKYRQGSEVNMAVRRLISMGRIKQKYVILNLPSSAELDTDLRMLCDVWVIVRRRGAARVYSLGFHPFENKPLPKHRQVLKWSDLPKSGKLRDIYDQLTEEKDRRLDGDGESYVPKGEVEEMIEKAEDEGQAARRDELIYELHQAGMSQAKIASLDSMPSQPRISQIITRQREGGAAD